jgi:putative acetyltransferase
MMIIRQERPEDVAGIRHVNEQAFDGPAEADLVDLLRTRGKVVLSLVAAQDDRIVGHILFSPVMIESDGKLDASAAGLAPMAVLPELQKQGVGSRLVKHGLEQCRKIGYQCVVVLGHADYYPRFGFLPASRYGLKCVYDVPDEVFMAIELREGALAGRTGIVKYQPEFNEV